MANETVNRTVNIFIQSGEAQRVYDQLIQKQQKLNDQLAQSPKNAAKIREELAKLEEPISRASKKLSGELSPSIREIEATVNKLGNRLKTMSTQDADFTKVLKQYKEANILLETQRQKIGAIKSAHEESFAEIFKRVAEFSGAYAIISSVTSAVKDFFKTSIEEALLAEQHTARFKATLEGIGHLEVFDRMMAKAEEVTRRFAFLDKKDVVGVFEKLIDFGKLTEDQMKNLLPVIINFASKEGISLAEATDVFTKALEGNAKGLKTFGIELSQTHTPAERLNVLMTTLKDKVDGAADAFQKTASGGIAVARQQFKNLAEDLGSIVLPALNKVLDFTVKALKGLKGITIESEELAQEQETGLEFHAKVLVEKYQKLINEKKLTLDKITGELQRRIDNGTASDAEKLALSKLTHPILGNGDPNADPAAAKRAEEARKKALADEKRALEDLAKLNRESGVINQSEIEKEIEATFEKYEGLKKLAHGNREILKQIDEGFYKALGLIREKYAQKELEAYDKARANFEKANQEFFNTAVKQSTTFLSRFEKILFGGEGQSSSEKIAQLNLQIARASGEKQFKLQQQKLDEERAAAIEAATQKGESIAKVNAEFDLKDDQLKQQHLQAQIALYTNFAQQITGILSTIDDAKTHKENAELARDQKLNDKKKKNLDAQLKAGLISQQDYDRKVAAIEKAQDQRQHEIAVRQFRRNQRMQIVQALMSGAEAVASTLAARPGSLDVATFGIIRAIEIGLAVATVAAQIATIAGQKPPEFGRGGKTSGRSHTEGGMGVYDHTGKKQAELEGDEGIINKHSMRDRSRYTVSGTTSQIASFLNSRGGGISWEPGAILRPSWMNHSPRPMNFAALRQAHQYAAGGQFQKAAAPTSTDESQLLLTSILLQLSSSVDSLNGQLSRGIVAKTFLTDQEAQQDRLNSIRDDATFKA